MASLTIELLGGLNIKQDGRALATFKSRKAEALLAYLVYGQRPLTREELAAFFWKESKPAQAQANLRKLLSDCRQVVGSFLLIDRETVAFDTNSDYWLDVDEFLAAIKALSPYGQDRQSPHEDLYISQLEQAITLYKGDFLAGFYLRDSIHFDEWAALERERLRLTAVTARKQLATYCLHRRAYQQGILHATHLLAMDPLHEESHRLLMRLLARAGQRSAALAHYADCERTLADDLAVPPMPETTAVYERIRQAPERPYHFPFHLPPLVGRETELVHISQQLDAAPDHPAYGRLLTLVGPGGVGKTRLALAATADLSTDHRHGVYLVPLAGLAPADNPRLHLVAAIAHALSVPFSGSHSPEGQLLDYLREKELLLILDNFEQFLAAANWLQTLRQQAPHVTCVVTSRQPLRLPGEWVRPLRGLPFPPAVGHQHTLFSGLSKHHPAQHSEHWSLTTEYPALQLFQQHAQRVNPGFTLTADTQTDVIRICQLVEGLPLALELAATAVRAFSPAHIAQQLQNNVDFLATRDRDRPARHRSARAVFAYAWELLNPRERALFSRLSLFHGGFSVDAAVTVAQASPAMLRALAEKSMLRAEPSGRYQIHELLRQYGREQLRATAVYPAIRAAHGRYYGHWLQAQASRLHGPEQKAALDAIGVNLNDTLAAWQWAVHHPDTAVLSQMAEGLYRFYVWKGRFQEGAALFQQASTSPSITTSAPTIIAQLMIRQAAVLTRLNQYDQALAALETGVTLAENGRLTSEIALAHLIRGRIAAGRNQHQAAAAAYAKSLALYRQLGDQAGEADALYSSGQLSFHQSRYEQAQDCFQKAQAIYQQMGNQYSLAYALSGLASIWQNWANDYPTAKTMYEQALAMKRESGDLAGAAADLNMMAILACHMKEWTLAIQCYEESLAIRREMGVPLVIAMVLGNLGTVYHELGRYDTARAMYTESLAISQRIGDELGVAFCLVNLAEVAHETGLYEQSAQQWREALALGCRLQRDDRMLYALVGVALLWCDQQTAVYNPTQGRRLLQYAYRHPACDQDAKERIVKLAPDVVALTLPEPETRPLAIVAAEVLALMT